MNSEVPDIENCCVKEAYAFFGLAAYCAQVLEHGAIHLAYAASLPDVHLVTPALHDELNNSLARKTFGQLLVACRKAVEIPDDTLDKLLEALELRNMLTHRYFRERADKFMSDGGRQLMMSELQEIIRKFKAADTLLEGIYMPILKKYGVTEEYVEKALEKMQHEARENFGRA